MLDLSKIKTVSIKQRKHKVSLDSLVKPENSRIFMRSKEFNELVDRVIKSKKNNRKIILMIGAHVIKTGMSLLIIDLMKKGVISHIAMNGAGPIHDFELAYMGETSEYVEETIIDGSFGMVEETPRMLNEAINEGAQNGYGMGYSVGKKIYELNLKNKECSILYLAYNLGVPATVHVAIGTDTLHQHPSCDGAAVGKTTYDDFKIFAKTVSELDRGVVINIGCAVILPEVFLKALSAARNLGYKVEGLTAANFDMIDHYRPRQNVVARPTAGTGKGFVIIGKHEKTIPSLHRKIIDSLK